VTHIVATLVVREAHAVEALNYEGDKKTENVNYVGVPT
jgi:hypothetical protein